MTQDNGMGDAAESTADSFRERVAEIREERERQNEKNPNWPGFKILLGTERGGRDSHNTVGSEVVKTDDGFVEIRKDDGTVVEAFNERFFVGYKPRSD